MELIYVYKKYIKEIYCNFWNEVDYHSGTFCFPTSLSASKVDYSLLKCNSEF